MSDVGDIPALWRRIDAWPGELKQALMAEAQAQAKVEAVQQQLKEAIGLVESPRNYRGYAPGGLLSSGSPLVRTMEETLARRKIDRSKNLLEQERNDAMRRVLEDFQKRGQRTPAEHVMRALVESDAQVKARREEHQQVKEELEELLWRQTPVISLSEQESADDESEDVDQDDNGDSDDSDYVTDVHRLSSEVAAAEAELAAARAEVKHQRAVGRVLKLLVQLAAVAVAR